MTRRDAVGLDDARRLHGDRAEHGDLDGHRGAGHELGGGHGAGGRGVEGRAGRLRGAGEQLDQRGVLARRQHLGLDVEPELAGDELPLTVDLPGPRGTGHVPGDDVAGRGGVPDGGQGEQPLLLLRRGRGGHDEVVRGPGLRVGAAGPAGQHGADAGHGHGVGDLGGPRLQRGQGLGQGAHGGDPVGREQGEVLAEADQRDAHPVGPAVGGQLDDHGGQGGGNRVLGAAQADQAVRGLEVDEHPAAAVGAEGDEPGERGERAGDLLGVQPVQGGGGQPPHLAVADGGPRGRRAEVGGGDPQVQVLGAEVGGDDGRRSAAVLAERLGQVAQAGVEQPGQRLLRAQAHGDLGAGRGRPPGRRSGRRRPGARAARGDGGRARPARPRPAARRRPARRGRSGRAAGPGPRARRWSRRAGRRPRGRRRPGRRSPASAWPPPWAWWPWSLDTVRTSDPWSPAWWCPSAITSMPGPCASAGMCSTQPGRIRLEMVSMEPSGWTRSLFISKISR